MNISYCVHLRMENTHHAIEKNMGKNCLVVTLLLVRD